MKKRERKIEREREREREKALKLNINYVEVESVLANFIPPVNGGYLGYYLVLISLFHLKNCLFKGEKGGLTK